MLQLANRPSHPLYSLSDGTHATSHLFRNPIPYKCFLMDVSTTYLRRSVLITSFFPTFLYNVFLTLSLLVSSSLCFSKVPCTFQRGFFLTICLLESWFFFQMLEKFAEDDRIEQMNAQKRRMKQLEHKKAVEKLIEDRRIQFQRERVRTK